MRRACGVRRQISLKPDSCTVGMHVDAAGISVEVACSYPGRSVLLPRASVIERWRDGRIEVSRGHSRLISTEPKA